MNAFLYRLFGAAMLDAGTYEGVESDRRSTTQAAAAVILASLAAGLGASRGYGMSLGMLLGFTAIALVTWLAWAMLTFQIGSRWLPGPDTHTSPGELIRTVGFAAAPGILQAAAALTQMPLPIFVLAWAWMFAAMVVAVKHALDYDRFGKAIAVCALAATVAAAFAVIVGLVFTRTVS